MSEKQPTILLLLRESAKNSREKQYRKVARSCADQLEKAIEELYEWPSYENMIDVNGLFSLADRIMNKLQPQDDGPDGGGNGDIWEAKHTEAVAV